MMTLHELGMKHCTDKATHHQFCHVYASTLDPLRHEPIRFLEIGVFRGGSAKMWREYFTTAELHFIDHLDELRANLPTNVGFSCVDCEVKSEIDKFASENGKWDVVLDDGGHTMWQQQTALAGLWPTVKCGGIFIMEDLHTSFGGRLAQCNKEGITTTYNALMALKKDEPFWTRAIDQATFDVIRSETESVSIWSRVPNDLSVSTTAIIRKKQ